MSFLSLAVPIGKWGGLRDLKDVLYSSCVRYTPSREYRCELLPSFKLTGFKGLFFIVVLFSYVYVCVQVLDPLDLELQAIVCLPNVVLGTELQASCMFLSN